MSKVYVLTFSCEYGIFVEGTFSSYSAMMTYLYEKYGYEANYNTDIAHWSKSETYGCFTKPLHVDKDRHTVKYWVTSLIGETSHKTDKLVIK